MLKKITKFSLISLTLLLILIIFFLSYIINLKSNISDNVLRLHIVGASNSEYDQQIKLKVRDRIIEDFSDLFSNCTSKQDAAKTANALKSQIEASANDELLKNGYDSLAVSTVEQCKFPTKVYGGIALPGGEYTALNIKIGDAEGKNWWCVMYPPLCLSGSSVIASENSMQILKNSLSDEEYRLICENNAPDIKIKFKIAEMLGRYF